MHESPSSPAPIQAVIFDLDGTLIDTLADLAAAGNHVLARYGRAPLPVGRYNHLVGQGVRSLIVDAFGGEDEIDVDAGVAEFRAYYDQHKYDQTAPYPGIPALLDTLRARGLKLGVLSNKPDDATREMVHELFPGGGFDVVRGHREGTPLKPDAGSAGEVAAELGIRAEACAYVGDTKVDMLTGRRAGMFTVGVTWGFRSEAELRAHAADEIIHEPSELPPRLR